MAQKGVDDSATPELGSVVQSRPAVVRLRVHVYLEADQMLNDGVVSLASGPAQRRLAAYIGYLGVENAAFRVKEESFDHLQSTSLAGK